MRKDAGRDFGAARAAVVIRWQWAEPARPDTTLVQKAKGVGPTAKADATENKLEAASFGGLFQSAEFYPPAAIADL